MSAARCASAVRALRTTLACSLSCFSSSSLFSTSRCSFSWYYAQCFIDLQARHYTTTLCL
ncbi:hypothetical protein PR003_g24190 [Phytophthora rubi]|uniref:Secreted protein n=1 Tax=Phytophthora rubi TaxID=129364 RepID=A0A6A3H6U5_9STRA|nr:hypothetical protein PR001_g29031 [Phytophthora rubi]KAE8981376.1 hypothetical protein PR002_g23851 [Phytophthora rubi]KAE9294728.1 hypothetical protein PR003_g24190 [Phytophthora rubi]